MIDYSAILKRRYPGKYRSVNANDPDQIVMKEGEKKPNKKELDALWPEVEAEIEAERQERDQKDEEIESLKEEIRTTKPPQSLPGLSERVEKLEKLFGLR